MLQLGQAALSLDSPAHTAAQVLACLHGPETESYGNETEATAKGHDERYRSMEERPLATLHDNDRYGVVKIVWTAEEDQQLLQVRPEYCLPLWRSNWNRGLGTPARETECAQALLTECVLPPQWQLVHELGPRRWSAIAAQLPGRVGKQCRERCAGA